GTLRYSWSSATRDGGGRRSPCCRRPSPVPWPRNSTRFHSGSRTHDVAVDGPEEHFDRFLGYRVSTSKLSAVLEPVHASVFSCNEAVESRCHVDRYTGLRALHRDSSTLAGMDHLYSPGRTTFGRLVTGRETPRGQLCRNAPSHLPESFSDIYE